MSKQNSEIIRIGKWRVLVDKRDAKRVLSKKWRVYLTGRSPKIVTCVSGDKQMTLARFILRPPGDDLVFLKSLNTVRGSWDFRRQNLATGRRGERIRLLPKNSKRRTSIYKGVSKVANSMWRASISFNGESKNLGDFHTELEAAKAYNLMATILFGKRAFLNSL